MDEHCEKIQDLLADDILGYLSADEYENVHEHVNRCPNCRQYKQALEEDHRALMEFGENVKGTIKARQDRVIHALSNASQATYKEKLPLWRIIMKNKKTKFAAAVLLIAVLVGLYEIGGTRAAFAQTTRFVRTTLAGLKEFVLDVKSREADHHIEAPPFPPAKSARQIPSVQGNIIAADVKEYAVIGKQNDLQDFFENKSVEWIPSENDLRMWYARLDHDKTGHFIDFAGSCDNLQLRSSPRLLLGEGQEGKVGSFGNQDEDAVALALVATVLGDDKSIELSFSFLRGQNGFEMPRLRLETDKAILFRLLTNMESRNNGIDTENVIFVLVQIEVRSSI